MWRHNVLCTCLSFLVVTATIWVQTLHSSSLNHCSRSPLSECLLCARYHAVSYSFSPILKTITQHSIIPIFSNRRWSLKKVKWPDQSPSTQKMRSKDLKWGLYWLQQLLFYSSALSIALPLNSKGCQTHFHQGPHQPGGCLQRAKIISRLCKCKYSLIVKEMKLHLALWMQLQGWCGPR